jgi:hypothetical protein
LALLILGMNCKLLACDYVHKLAKSSRHSATPENSLPPLPKIPILSYPSHTSVLVGQKVMKVWITCFVVLLGVSELLQWVKQFSLPLPVFILGGAFLAIASNYDKLSHLPFHPDYDLPEVEPPAASQTMAATGRSLNQHEKPISFTIQKPHQPGN